ncbi:GNAT family N-acetyltransferase [Robiginitomaculum antarcticum]|uniref:GNAT family N-acetyltransferase n=1 Tax=Robiginitomaculum antarcticum TaxID=437507 RepID=UPI00035F81E1|nr:GNAT family N-acetyltransferase [Robiginitomaculum antarcticum]
MTAFSLRNVAPADYAEILPIYNDVVARSTAIYSDDPATLGDIENYGQMRLSEGFPFIVAVDDDGKIAGYGTYGTFRARPGYRYTVEHSVHIRPDLRGAGVGSMLMGELIKLAKAGGYHIMIGAVDAQNEGSLRFHDRLGFTRSARLDEIGRKFGRWLDVVFVTLNLD